MKWTAVILLGVIGLGCDDNAGGGAECAENRECELPNSCIGGRCILECRISRDCPQNHVCFENACYAPAASCVSDDECEPFGQVCDPTRNVCAPVGAVRCDDELNPCLPGSRCIDGGCRIRTSDGGVRRDVGPRPDRGLSPDARVANPDARVVEPDARVIGDPDGAVLRPDAGSPDGALPDVGPNGGAYGDPCTCGSECASGFCVENKLRAMRTCTGLCDVPGDCPGLDVCVQAQQSGPTASCPEPLDPEGPQIGDIVGVCIPNETGVACDFERAQCTGGFCIRPPIPTDAVDPQPTCAVTCEDDRKCPPGYSCKNTPTLTPNGQMVDTRLCAPAVDLIPCEDGHIDLCGGTCPGVAPEQEAGVTFCMGPLQGNGFCSCSCQTAVDCPTGFACSADPAFPSGDPARPQLCIPIAGYRCPDGDPSRCAISCLADEDDPLASVCTTQCDNAADCPADHGCEPIPDGGTYCIPDQR